MTFPPSAQKRHTYPLYMLPVWSVGNGVVCPLQKVVRQLLGIYPGVLLIGRLHAPYFTIRIAVPERLIPIDTFGPDVLPPSWPGKEDNATTPDDTPRTVAPAPGAHARDDQ